MRAERGGGEASTPIRGGSWCESPCRARPALPVDVGRGMSIAISRLPVDRAAGAITWRLPAFDEGEGWSGRCVPLPNSVRKPATLATM